MTVLHSRIFDIIKKVHTEDLRKLAYLLASELEEADPRRLMRLEPKYQNEYEFHFKPEPVVIEMAKELKMLKVSYRHWYEPDFIIMSAMIAPRTTEEIRKYLYALSGKPKTVQEETKVKKIIQLVLSVAGMINSPRYATDAEGKKTTKRMWGFAKGVTPFEDQVKECFHERMKE